MNNKHSNQTASVLTDTTTNTAAPVVPAPKVKPPLIPTPAVVTSPRKPLRMKVNVGSAFLRSFEIPTPGSRRPTRIIHAYPLLSAWVGRSLPDSVNPRSHDEDCLKSPVARQIEHTILDCPEDFILANRGVSIIANEANFDPKTGDLELVIADPDNQGIADGATTDAVIAKVQTALAREHLAISDASYEDLLTLPHKDQPATLRNGRVHLEIVVGVEDRVSLANLVGGRNTSRQVRGWSMADFRGEFEWIKNILDAPDSPFAGKVGYEENSGKDVNILDVLALLTLFHPEYDKKDEGGTAKAPVVAYANRGRMDLRLSDEVLRAGYETLAPVLPDILRLHDYIYVNFETAYNAVFGSRSRLSRRQGVESRITGRPYVLPLTGASSQYVLPKGYVLPVLAAMRALLSKRGTGRVHWRTNPFEFFDTYGKDLVAELMEQVDAVGGNPNAVGKNKLAYTAIHAQAQLDLVEELEKNRK